MALLDLIGELTGVLQGLPPQLARTYINRALEGIYDEREWSFLMTDGVIICPAQYATGTANVTQYLDTVTLDATASAAIANQLTVNAVPGILQLQFRVQATPPSAGAIYSIVAFDDSNPAAVILTLDRVMQQATDATASYAIYRCYVVPPITDFLRFESLVDQANAITLTKNRLTVSSSDFDRMDPQRANTGLAYWLGGWGGNRVSDPVTGATTPNATVEAGTPIYEFWPHPTSGQAWYVRFRRKGQLLTRPTDSQVSQISNNLIIQRALYMHAYPFAAANVANFPGFKGANWPSLIMGARANYTSELLEAKKNDNNQQLQDVWDRGHGLRSGTAFGRYDVPGYPIDANFLQSHLIRF